MPAPLKIGSISKVLPINSGDFKLHARCVHISSGGVLFWRKGFSKDQAPKLCNTAFHFPLIPDARVTPQTALQYSLSLLEEVNKLNCYIALVLILVEVLDCSYK